MQLDSQTFVFSHYQDSCFPKKDNSPKRCIYKLLGELFSKMFIHLLKVKYEKNY